jgi:hypothetical protein
VKVNNRSAKILIPWNKLQVDEDSH